MDRGNSKPPNLSGFFCITGIFQATVIFGLCIFFYYSHFFPIMTVNSAIQTKALTVSPPFLPKNPQKAATPSAVFVFATKNRPKTVYSLTKQQVNAIHKQKSAARRAATNRPIMQIVKFGSCARVCFPHDSNSYYMVGQKPPGTVDFRTKTDGPDQKKGRPTALPAFTVKITPERKK